MIYLASPYSHPDASIRERRFHEACRATVFLMQQGQVVFSPIAHSHPLVSFGLPTDWSYWERFDGEHIRRCDEVMVLMLDGWRDSPGITAEVRLARSLAKPVHYLSVDRVTGSPTVAHVATEAGS